ncbi:acyltransferase [Enterobacter hormaechei]|uniref:acyltransferase family protein n=2 Tax=Enterobacter hormaechei TaxID=158836 RepID=UPI001AE90A4B|nr:acyltransferase [Enterobacter hormaechei]MBP0994770.1 acyltransferase [Enterobacter hormaechei]MBP1028645.1 acyltransferase [Enterobacter hormaechei]MCE1541101.1 acyltransferase [Enterobacter hormaechei]MCE1941202.1 acyltransferase [Enterobacter hormaechei]
MDYPNIKKLLKKIKSNQMNSKILSVHYLRAIACIAVLVDHFSGLLIINGNPIPYLERGAFGVDLFYIISGFIIYISSGNKEGNTPVKFIAKRFFRIYPLMIVAWVIGMTFVFNYNGVWEFFSPLLLVYQNYNGLAPQFGTHAMGTPWTLAYELLFYGIFVFALSITHKHRAALSILLLVLIPVSLQFAFNGSFSIQSSAFAKADEDIPFYGLIRMASGTIMFEFAVGIVFGVVFKKMRKIDTTSTASTIIFYSGILLAIAILLTNGDGISTFGLQGFFIPSLVLFLSFFFRDKTYTIKHNEFLDFFGNISYSLYITHFIIYVWIVHHLDRVWMEPVRGYPIVIIGMVISVIFSWICYNFIEKPGVRLGKRFS